MRIISRIAASLLIIGIVASASLFTAHAQTTEGARNPVALGSAAKLAQVSGMTVTSISAVTGGSSELYEISATKPGSVCPSTGAAMHCLVLKDKQYQIAVTGKTRILNKKRGAPGGDIEVGDVINAYGYLDAAGNMQAQIVRDLSKPAPASSLKGIKVLKGSADLRQGREATVTFAADGGKAPYTWSASGLPAGMQLVTAHVIYCIKAPCPQADTTNVDLSGTPSIAGVFKSRIVVTDAAGKSASIQVPFTVASQSDLRVSVKTNDTTYRSNQNVRIDITLTNTGDQADTENFSNGCQALYSFNPGASTRGSIDPCEMQSPTSITLRGGESHTWSFDYNLKTNPLQGVSYPATVVINAVVPGIAQESTTITINP